MKYICFDHDAIQEFASSRTFQSIDFDNSERFVAYISCGKENDFTWLPSGVRGIETKSGTFFLTPGNWTQKKHLVIDLEESKLFSGHSASSILAIAQKLFRFSIKYWSNIALNHSEKLIAGSTKAVVFPLPISTASRFRVVIERTPLAARLEKRGLKGNFLLVYKSSVQGGDSANEVANLTVFRKVLDEIAGSSESATNLTTSSGGLHDRTIIGVNLDSQITEKPQSIFRSYEEWMRLITRQQKSFVMGDLEKPHKLEGPAGTGKTLALLLRTIRLLNDAEQNGRIMKALFITHSEVTRTSIVNVLDAMDSQQFHMRSPEMKSVSLQVSTLAGLCAEILKQKISDLEFVDRDAQDSKILQEMYIEEALKKAKLDQFSSYEPFMSSSMRNMIIESNPNEISSLFQHEISILIKGRAGDSLDAYKNCPSLKYGLPVENGGDKGYVFQVFQYYQEQLEASGQFDTDDVVLSAVGQLDTPIWRRRRSREGFDFIAIDETHLFNINELHVFHYFTRKLGVCPISFSMDTAQAVGDRGWNDEAVSGNMFDVDVNIENVTSMRAVFRSSPQITRVASSILSSGATIFTNFDNTLAESNSAFTIEDEKRAVEVKYFECIGDDDMMEKAFLRIDSLAESTSSKRWELLITSLSFDICERLKKIADQRNKAITYLEKRGDYETIARARKSGHVVLGHADYVGGLEFNAVVVVGVDKGRVPFEGNMSHANSRSFSSFSAHNRLYVAATRAKYALEFLGDRSRGPSIILVPAMEEGIVIKGVNV